VRVIRGRAEEPDVVRLVGNSDWVVARAVAPLDRLVRWCLPLLSDQGRLLALKGAGAADEAARHASALRASGARIAAVEELGGELLGERTWVVVVTRAGRTKARER
jgi:16S rRNA (guanine527-N7)-methyltransferase